MKQQRLTLEAMPNLSTESWQPCDEADVATTKGNPCLGQVVIVVTPGKI